MFFEYIYHDLLVIYVLGHLSASNVQYGEILSNDLVVYNHNNCFPGFLQLFTNGLQLSNYRASVFSKRPS